MAGLTRLDPLICNQQRLNEILQDWELLGKEDHQKLIIIQDESGAFPQTAPRSFNFYKEIGSVFSNFSNKSEEIKVADFVADFILANRESFMSFNLAESSVDTLLVRLQMTYRQFNRLSDIIEDVVTQIRQARANQWIMLVNENQSKEVSEKIEKIKEKIKKLESEKERIEKNNQEIQKIIYIPQSDIANIGLESLHRDTKGKNSVLLCENNEEVYVHTGLIQNLEGYCNQDIREKYNEKTGIGYSCKDGINRTKVDLTNFSADVVKLFVDFLYGKPLKIPENQAADLLKLADFLNCEIFLKHCEQLIIEDIGADLQKCLRWKSEDSLFLIQEHIQKVEKYTLDGTITSYQNKIASLEEKNKSLSIDLESKDILILKLKEELDFLRYRLREMTERLNELKEIQ